MTKTNQAIAKSSKTMRNDPTNAGSSGANSMNKIYLNNGTPHSLLNQTGRSTTNERQPSNDSGGVTVVNARGPMHNRLPSGKSRQQAIRAKTKIYANRNILGNSSIATPSSQIGSTKNVSKIIPKGGQASKGNLSMQSSNPKIK